MEGLIFGILRYFYPWTSRSRRINLNEFLFLKFSYSSNGLKIKR